MKVRVLALDFADDSKRIIICCETRNKNDKTKMENKLSLLGYIYIGYDSKGLMIKMDKLLFLSLSMVDDDDEDRMGTCLFNVIVC